MFTQGSASIVLDGIVNLLKPPGMTSHDAVAAMRRMLGTRRIGHTGTLDPGAVGVLPLCVGKATRLVQFIQATQKSYRAEITLGVETDTLDAAGTTTSVTTDFALPVSRLVDVMMSYQGEILQTPPMVSSVRIAGERLYKAARRGEVVERPPRPVHIYRLQIVRIWPEDALDLEFGSRILFDVDCSKGTYIRSLAADIGRDLGCGAHLSFLVRTASGPFHLADTKTFEEIREIIDKDGPEAVLQPMEAGVAHLPRFDLTRAESKQIGHGQMIPAPHEAVDQPYVRLHDETSGKLIAIASGTRRSGRPVWKPICVLESSNEGAGAS